MTIERVAIEKLRGNADNPRTISDAKYAALVQSLRTFPQMLELRPLVVDASYTVLGGNMRLKACADAGISIVPVVMADTLTPEQQREFIIKDNVSFGEWDWDTLSNDWDVPQLEAWGLDIPDFAEESDDNLYTLKIEAPVYTPSRAAKPSIAELVDVTVYDKLMTDINDAQCAESDKHFLRLAACRHLKFSYEDIAEFYAHSSAAVQHLMEKSALVIIDYDKAVANGFVETSQRLAELTDNDDVN